MTKRYLLLNPLTPEDFGLHTFDEIDEALQEFGCGMILSMDTKGYIVAFAVSNTVEALQQMVTAVDLDGTMVEYTGIYDQMVRL